MNVSLFFLAWLYVYTVYFIQCVCYKSKRKYFLHFPCMMIPFSNVRMKYLAIISDICMYITILVSLYELQLHCKIIFWLILNLFISTKTSVITTLNQIDLCFLFSPNIKRGNVRIIALHTVAKTYVNPL